MKILTSQQIREADQYTIKHEPIKSIDLMERAATACFQWLDARLYDEPIKIFCGPGNNGGDGLALARILLDERKLNVQVFIIRGYEKYSPDFLANEKRLRENHKSVIHDIHSIKDFPKLIKNNWVIDAIFGTGLNKPVTGLAAEVIDKINKSNTTVVSVDIPSGLFADLASSPQSSIIKADYTITFQCTKLAFLFPENYSYVGKIRVLDIELDEKFIAGIDSNKSILSENKVKKLLIQRGKFDHKGTHGHALLIAGSYGKMGAAVLASRACMRAGAGLLTVHIPQCGYEIMQSAFPEAMADVDTDEKYFSDDIKTDGFDTIGIGPGLSMKDKTAKALKKIFESNKKPMVIDADAINILAENKSWLKEVPEQSIFTPHPKEFERLVGKAANDFEQHQMQLDFAMKHKVFVILKGANTCIACPDGAAYFNSTGNPGMATAGSGDVLTGILTGLLAQGYSSLHASLLGVYLHGLAGDIAAEKKSVYSVIAGDIIKALPFAYTELLES